MYSPSTYTWLAKTVHAHKRAVLAVHVYFAVLNLIKNAHRDAGTLSKWDPIFTSRMHRLDSI